MNTTLDLHAQIAAAVARMRDEAELVLRVADTLNVTRVAEKVLRACDLTDDVLARHDKQFGIRCPACDQVRPCPEIRALATMWLGPDYRATND